MKKIQVLTILSLSVVTLLGYQNCGRNDAQFNATNDTALTSQGVTTPLSVEDSVKRDGALVELQGYCDDEGNPIEVGGEGILKSVAKCDDDDTFRVCTLVQETGERVIEIEQTTITEEIITVEVPIDITYVTEITHILEIVSLEMISQTVAELIVTCEPGSILTGTLYGSNIMANGSQTCSAEGRITIRVNNLIANLEGSAQRFIQIHQQSQSGSVTYVGIDVDYSDVHTCSVERWVANTEICQDSAGEIEGSCLEGHPVRVMVNGVTQQIVSCSENSRFSADNVLLTDVAGANKVTISQSTPFGEPCVAELIE